MTTDKKPSRPPHWIPAYEPRPPDRVEERADLLEALTSLLCPAVPVFGLIARSPLFFFLGALTSLIGSIWALSGSLSHRPGPLSAIWTLSLVLNSLVTCFFLWLIFIQGLC